MDDIRHLIDTARRRLAATRYLRGVHVTFVAGAILALLLVLLAKSSPAVVLPWKWLLVGGFVALVAAGFLAMRFGGLSTMSLSVLVDERLGLKERLSTALAVRDRADPFARAAVADAVTTAKDKRTQESLRRHFPVQAPANSWIGPVLAVAAAACCFLPQGDLFKRNQVDDTALVNATREADQAMQKVKDAIEKNDKLADVVSKKADGALSENRDPAKEKLVTSADIKRDAIKKMNEMQRKLEEILKGKDAQSLDALKGQLSDLDPQEGPADELGKALKEGDFSKAKKALEDLKNSIDGKSDEEKKAIEQQLDSLAGQLGKLAENQKSLENALQKAGLDAQLASNPQALEQALNNAKNLTAAQKQAIQQAAAAQQAAAQQCKGMGKAMKQAAQSMCQGNGQKGGQKGDKPGGQGQPGEGQGDMEAMLSNLEGMQQMLDAAGAAANEAQSQCNGQGDKMGQCMGNPNDNVSNKNGWQGNRGRANGGSGAQATPTPTGTKTEKEKVEATEGQIIMKQLIEGQHPERTGDAQYKAEKVAADIAKSMEGSVTEEQVPTHLQDLHKHYFGEMKRLIEAKNRGEAPATKETDTKEKAPSEPVKKAS